MGRRDLRVSPESIIDLLKAGALPGLPTLPADTRIIGWGVTPSDLTVITYHLESAEWDDVGDWRSRIETKG